MLISKTNLALTSQHELQTTAAMLLRIDQAPGAAPSFGQLFERQLQAPPAQLLQVEAPDTSQKPEKKDADGPFKAIMELLFGVAHTPDSPDTPVPTAAAGTPGEALPQADFRSLRLMQRSESESCSFAASGNICLADGSQRQFDVSYRMARSEEWSSLDIGAGFKDPLMLDFAAPSATLGKPEVAFDLDSDGQCENMRLPSGDTAVLFCDRNHNGIADNGSELFGPQSGNGFEELAKLDNDGNGWIDGGDAAYADLKLWQVGADGQNKVRSLADAEIGALSTASADTPFTLKENGSAVAQVRASSVWLGEHSGAGIIRQVDVATTAIVPPPA